MNVFWPVTLRYKLPETGGDSPITTFTNWTARIIFGRREGPGGEGGISLCKAQIVWGFMVIVRMRDTLVV